MVKTSAQPYKHISGCLMKPSQLLSMSMFNNQSEPCIFSW